MIDIVHQQLINAGIEEARQKIKDLQNRMPKRKKTATILREVDGILLDLVSLHQITPKVLEIKYYSLPTLLDAIPQMYGAFFKKQRLDFKVIPMASLQISVDQTAFFRIFFNLIYYMAQYADGQAEEGSFIQVEAKPYNEELVAIYIEDNGRYPAGIHDDVFDGPYSKRVLNTIAGVGLGVVKEWMLALRGSIQLVDKLGAGIKCCLLLPIKKSDVIRKQVPANAPAMIGNEVNKHLLKAPEDKYLR